MAGVCAASVIYPGLCRMDALEQCVERKGAILRDNNLAVYYEALRRQGLKGFNEFGKIARQRPPRLRLEPDFRGFAEYEAAKAVPFGLVLPAISRRDLLDRERLHRGQWLLDREHASTGSVPPRPRRRSSR